MTLKDERFFRRKKKLLAKKRLDFEQANVLVRA